VVSLEGLPFPIAAPFAGLARSRGGSGREVFERMVAAYEGVLRTLGVVALSSYLEHGPSDPARDALLERCFGERLSTGRWIEILRELLGLWRSDPSKCAIPELVAFWYPARGKRPTTDAEDLERFAGKRNDWAHLRQNDREREAVVAEFLPVFDRILDRLAFLERYDLLVPFRVAPEAGDRVRVSEAVSCRGTRPHDVRTDIVVAGPIETGEDLVLDGGRLPVRLYPLAFPEVGGEGDDVFLYEGNTRRAGVVRRLDFLSMATNEQRSVDARSASPALRVFAQRMSRWLGSKTERPSADEDAVFHAMTDIVRTASAGFVGREDLLRSFEAAAGSGGGKTLLVVGPPGAGKTALLAAAALRLRAEAVHLAGPDGGRDDPRLAARSIVAQILSARAVRRAIPEDQGAALKLLSETLSETRPEESMVIVADAIDELRRLPDGSPDLSLLPKPAPPGVLFIASCRDDEVAAIAERIPGVERVSLGPLSEVDAIAMARAIAPRRSDEEVALLCRASEGNPLFLETLLRSEHSVPAKVEDALDRALGKLRLDIPKIDVPRAVGLLAAARSGLARRDLVKILGVSPYEVGRLIAALRPLLREIGDRYVLYHSRVRSHVAEQLVGEEGMRERHAEIAALLETQLASDREDALLDIVGHLEAAGRSRAACDLLDTGFLVRKVKATGSLESVRGDLAAGVRCSGSDLPRAARLGLVAALISRGARALARRGVAAAIARSGDPRLAASIAGCVPQPEERDLAMEAVRQASASPEEFASGARSEPRTSDASGGSDATIAEARAVLASVDRGLRVRTWIGAAPGLPRDVGRELAARAIPEIELETSCDARDALTFQVIEVLGRLDEDGAVALADGLDAGIQRARAYASIGRFDAALDEVDRIEGAARREAGLAIVLERMAGVDPDRTFDLSAELEASIERDRVLLAVLNAKPDATKAALAVRDPGLRAFALSIAGLWDGAEQTAAAIAHDPIRAATLERLAGVALRRGDRARADRLRADAREIRSALPAAERAAALREAAALAAASDESHALRALEEVSPTTYEDARDVLVRRARILLARPSGANVRNAIVFSASFDDSFADLYPDVVEAMSSAFGARFPDAVLRAVEGLEAAEAQAAAILLAGLRVASSFEAPPPLDEAVAAAIETSEWALPAAVGRGLKPERDRLARQLREGRASEADVERLVELYLAAGDREQAAVALTTWAAAIAGRGDEARFLERARELDPLLRVRGSELEAPKAAATISDPFAGVSVISPPIPPIPLRPERSPPPASPAPPPFSLSVLAQQGDVSRPPSETEAEGLVDLRSMAGANVEGRRDDDRASMLALPTIAASAPSPRRPLAASARRGGWAALFAVVTFVAASAALLQFCGAS
jgi:hypothetical protein